MRRAIFREITVLALLAASLPLAACGRDAAERPVDEQAATSDEDGWRTDDRDEPDAAEQSADRTTDRPDPYGSEPELEPVPGDGPVERVIVVDREPAPSDREREQREAADRELRQREQRLARREAELRARERDLQRQREREAAARREAERAARAEPEERDERGGERNDRDGEPTEIAEAPRRPAPDVGDEREAEADREDERPAVPVTVPIGTPVDVEFLEALSSDASHVGESFRVRVARDVYAEGELAIPAGSEISGEVVQAQPLRKVGGRAILALDFSEIELPDGRREPIDASFLQQGRSETGRDAATIGGAAAGGAILGRILNKRDKGKGAVIGAVIGAAAGTAVAARSPGEEVEIPAGSVVTLALDEPLEVRLPRRR